MYIFLIIKHFSCLSNLASDAIFLLLHFDHVAVLGIKNTNPISYGKLKYRSTPNFTFIYFGLKIYFRVFVLFTNASFLLVQFLHAEIQEYLNEKNKDEKFIFN